MRILMTDELRARFRPQAPEGFVPVKTAMQRLGVTRQTIWNRIRTGQPESRHVTRGRRRGLHVRLPAPCLPLFETQAEDHGG